MVADPGGMYGENETSSAPQGRCEEYRQETCYRASVRRQTASVRGKLNGCHSQAQACPSCYGQNGCQAGARQCASCGQVPGQGRSRARRARGSHSSCAECPC